ncbi:MAG: hypothetical protein A3I07_04215 [Candidatus Doudnabacteria bacterium RIFCSPLOWO2_02_FULL_42_9]|uniref:O-antigen ligase-related domain-containing protein n=1 Tax=Candidatus Doudnabacteria bacterium RIFCSPHIGHO2_01_FULL_41_86 TaxID=1817821 RepID=A0A1F5N8M7_9BACT|nr:MAG: hypothetical protein A2717_00205 [Candidatus Doudnabacteria bacterium RIFCSPHIGHO2_01_FULL_41_86]OGE75113.1 MAG: hypothetical protein A3K07_03710 [Candidatus Doudnabacteria bacterium RIFCSPHIGHO2_01_43_10]OGE86374.1 MAG: hypothetical protein A3E28_00080 [Candidatus Doudnabacteria bacterium RIFCSPHIGHO2_12_FULL_42_22]OGE87373.1 MAG: hypothetical protein A3C49_04065 [Candidatus Doudnabacteria bacterium RIFCSPHIGHO2_02_FULL_42_25]OGE92671.1 MAG: hypothetical protein A2895_03560 [Candidatus
MVWFLALILAFAPIYLVRFQIGPLPTTLLEILIVGFLVGSVIRYQLSDIKQKIKSLGNINYAIILFVIAGIISTAFSPEPIKALGLLRAFIIEPILIFYAIVLTVNSKQITVIIKPLFWVTVLISAFGIFQYYSFIHLLPKFWGYGDEPRRIVSIFAHPNALSLYLAPLFAFFVTLWLNGYKLTKNIWISGIGLLIIGTALIVTFSRGAWLAVALSIFVVLINQFGLKKIIIPAVIGVLALLLISSIRDRITLGISDSSTNARLELMGIGVNKILDNPFLGNGLYGFRTTQAEAGYTGEIHNYPHNLFLALWVELGLLGILSFAWIINLALKQYQKSAFAKASADKHPQLIKFAASIFILTVLIHGLVDTSYFKNDLALLFWFAISLFYIKQ